jgi:hypothetical protein
LGDLDSSEDLAIFMVADILFQSNSQ